MKNKLFIDCQFFQTPVWHRGMGRYTLSLLKTFYEISDNTDLTFIFSSNLTQNEEMLQTLIKACPTAEFVHLPLETTTKKTYFEAAKQNKIILEDFIGKNRSDSARNIFMIACLFQEPTASVFPDDIETCLIYYDAVPLLYFNRYGKVWKYDNYLDRHKSLFQADKVFTISQTIADDLVVYYGLKNDNKRIVNIDGACIEGMFEEFTKSKMKLPEKYILFSTSDDIRKNNQAALLAFEQLKTLTGRDYALVITSNFDPSRKKALEELAEDVIFTGNVTDDELAWLYKNAEVVLFTSEYEGLGLPILESVKLGKKVACSNIPVFREISEEAFYFFDPHDIADITHALYRAINGADWEEKKALYARINGHYTWERSATIVREELSKNIKRKTDVKKLKVAVLAPAPDGFSAIGKVVQELHDVFSNYFDVDYYFENRKEKQPVHVRPNYLKHLVNCYDVEDFTPQLYKEYDAVIYHISNSEYSFYTIMNALYMPGIAIFHDLVLRDAFGEMVRLGIMTPERFNAEAKLDEMIGSERSGFLTSLVNNQLAGIVHSKYARDSVRPNIIESGIEIKESNLPTAVSSKNVQSQKRDAIHIGIAGNLSGRKGVGIIKDLAEDPDFAEKIVLHVFGFNFVEPKSIEDLKKYKNVRLSTNLSDLEYQTQLSDLDIIINYRSDYMGETSLTVLEAIRYGCVAIVNRDLGWFKELPNDAVVKIAEIDELKRTLKDLIKSHSKRKKIGAAAKEFIAKQHNPEKYVRQIAELIRSPKKSDVQTRANLIRKTSTLDELLMKLSDAQNKEARNG